MFEDGGTHNDAHYRRLVQEMRGCAIFSLDASGRIDTWNRGAELIHRHPADGILGRDFSHLFTDADARVGTPGSILATARARGSAAEECWMVRGDSSRFWASTVVTSIDAGAGLSGYGVVVRDVSSTKAYLDSVEDANNRLLQASRLKSEFLARMSHELRTPLTAMLGFSDVLLKGLDGELSAIQQEDVSRIKRSGLAILALINDILDLSKIESGRMTLKLQTLELSSLTNAVVASTRKLAADKGLYLVTDLPDHPVFEVVADPQRVSQVLSNLVGNAIKFTASGGVTVRATLGPAEARVEVRDTGVGIAPHALGMIWDEFREDNGGSIGRGSTGLGLAISRRLVNMQGGSIGVEPNPDGGSCFWFTLPRPDGAAEVASLSPAVHGRAPGTAPLQLGGPAVPAETRELILIVEEDDATRRVIASRLKEAGFRTVDAGGGAEAINAARELRPAVITLDMVMPSLEGWTVLAALRDDPRTRDIPVVVASIVDDRELAMSLGAADYVPKPFPIDDLLGAIERLLAGGPGRVLVVDDDEETRELVRRHLTAAGMEVQVAAGGNEALELAFGQDHDLLVTDLLMPEMSGFELILRLRAADRTRNLPIVVFTGKDLTRADHDNLNGQIERLMAKHEFGPADIVTTVRETIRARRR